MFSINKLITCNYNDTQMIFCYFDIVKLGDARLYYFCGGNRTKLNFLSKEGLKDLYGCVVVNISIT